MTSFHSLENKILSILISLRSISYFTLSSGDITQVGGLDARMIRQVTHFEISVDTETKWKPSLLRMKGDCTLFEEGRMHRKCFLKSSKVAFAFARYAILHHCCLRSLFVQPIASRQFVIIR